jgi:hypothetical protein
MTAEVLAPPVRDAAAGRHGPAAPRRRRRTGSLATLLGLRGPGWPLTALILLFPLWWALGLMELIFPILAVPMARELMRRRPIKLPPGFGLWLLFLIWVVVGIFMLSINPTGTLPAPASNRVIAYGVRVVEYSAVTIILLYIGNLRDHELSRQRVVGLLGGFFLMATAGGLLGTLLPYFEFPSPLELLLPGGMRSNLYVQSLVHPAASQIQDVLGYEAPRPKAPFNYTNSWGNNMAVLAAWFVAGWWARRGSRRRILCAIALAVAAIPLIYSLNRGVWIGIAAAVAYVAIRMAIGGRPVVLFGAVFVTAAVAAAVLLSPLSQVVQGRLDNPDSNSIRSSLSHQAVVVALRSPVVGFGSTRSALGSPQSITVGRSTACPKCGNFAIGSAGQLWLLLISTGYIGTGLYFGFFLVVLWRYRRDGTPIGIAGSLVVLLSFLFSLFYNSLTSPLFITMVSVALLWRNDQVRWAALAGPAPPVGPLPQARTPRAAR